MQKSLEIYKSKTQTKAPTQIKRGSSGPGIKRPSSGNGQQKG